MDLKKIKQIVAVSYDTQFSLYKEESLMQLGNLENLFKYLFESSIIPPEGKYLDLGCGIGIPSEMSQTPYQVLTEVYRILKSAGILGISVSGYGTAEQFQESYRKIIGKFHKDLDFKTELYRKEARHQRQMIWETVKWTTLILLGMYGLCAKYLSEFVLSPAEAIKGWVALAFIVMTLVPCVTYIQLLRSFYQSNMRYISMYIKVEDELCFDEREKKEQDRHVFSRDN